MVIVGMIGTFGRLPDDQRPDGHPGVRKGPGEYGLLGSVMAVGTLAGALLAARREGPRLRFLGGALGLRRLRPGFEPPCPRTGLRRASDPVAWPRSTFLNSCNTTIQLSVEPQFRGRVLALYIAVIQGGTAIGAPLIGLDRH